MYKIPIDYRSFDKAKVSLMIAKEETSYSLLSLLGNESIMTTEGSDKEMYVQFGETSAYNTYLEVDLTAQGVFQRPEVAQTHANTIASDFYKSTSITNGLQLIEENSAVCQFMLYGFENNTSLLRFSYQAGQPNLPSVPTKTMNILLKFPGVPFIGTKTNGINFVNSNLIVIVKWIGPNNLLRTTRFVYVINRPSNRFYAWNSIDATTDDKFSDLTRGFVGLPIANWGFAQNIDGTNYFTQSTNEKVIKEIFTSFNLSVESLDSDGNLNESSQFVKW